MDANFTHGKLIIPSNTPKAVVIFYPPATGDKGHQLDEANRLKEIDYASLLYNPPYRLKTNQGGLADPSGEKDLWLEAKNQFPELVQDLKKLFGSEQLKIFVIGKNLGGSVAAYSIDKSVSCLIVTGSVPILSTFWITSPHPVAVEARKGLSTEQLNRFQEISSDFDLTKTIQQLTQKVLIQFGKNDPWIEKEQSEVLKKNSSKESFIQWIVDDHIMGQEESVNQRKKFLQNCDQ